MKAGGRIRQYLVTDGVGFVGSHVTEALAKKGWRVKILDNFFNNERG